MARRWRVAVKVRGAHCTNGCRDIRDDRRNRAVENMALEKVRLPP
jgi:hypothetical protein